MRFCPLLPEAGFLKCWLQTRDGFKYSWKSLLNDHDPKIWLRTSKRVGTDHKTTHFELRRRGGLATGFTDLMSVQA